MTLKITLIFNFILGCVSMGEHGSFMMKNIHVINAKLKFKKGNT
jgi:hypothetical protein